MTSATTQPASPPGPNAAYDVVSIPSVVWSSRENLCAQLVSLLQRTPLDDDWVRQRLVRLIGRFDEAGQHQSLLRSVLLNPRETPDVKAAVMGLAPWRAPWLKLSREELSQLAGRTPSSEGDDLSSREPDSTFPLSSVLCEAGLDEDSVELAREVLSAETPSTRAFILHNQWPGALTPSLMEWLFLKWREEDRHHLAVDGSSGPEHNWRIALEYRDRPGMWELVTQWARDLSPHQLKERFLCLLSDEERVRLLGSHPELHQFAVQELLLPLDGMLAALGADGLKRVLRRLVREESLARVVDSPHIVQRPEPFRRAVTLLVEWREARPLLYELLCSFDVAFDTRQSLLWKLFEKDRSVALRWSLAASHYVDNVPLVLGVLHFAAQCPRPEDRPLLLRWLRDENPRGQALAIDGLLGLGESGPGWSDRLETLSRSDDAEVRLNAAAGLVREGRREWLEPLRRAAAEPPGTPLRTEAVRWLGEFDAENSRPLLHEALEAPATLTNPYGFGPPDPADEAVEAAWALTRLGTPEDLARLLDARVRGQCAWWFDVELERHVLRQEGHSLPAPPTSWTRGDPRASHRTTRRRKA